MIHSGSRFLNCLYQKDLVNSTDNPCYPPLNPKRIPLFPKINMKSINLSPKLAPEISWVLDSLGGPLLLPEISVMTLSESRFCLTLLNCLMYFLPNVLWKLYLEKVRENKYLEKLYPLFERDYHLRDGDTFVKGSLINMIT